MSREGAEKQVGEQAQHAKLYSDLLQALDKGTFDRLLPGLQGRGAGGLEGGLNFCIRGTPPRM